jgi:hypothetical protein
MATYSLLTKIVMMIKVRFVVAVLSLTLMEMYILLGKHLTQVGHL